MTITVVGLGPGAPGELTVEAQRVLAEAGTVWLRTTIHPVVKALSENLVLHDFDRYYEDGNDFEQVYDRICADLEQMGRSGDVVYAVPGHPLVGEATVRRLLERSRHGGPAIRIIAGLSFVEPVCTALGLDPVETGLQIVDALAPQIDPQRPALCGQVYSRQVASELKLALLELYPPEHQIQVVGAAGIAGRERIWAGSLADLDRADRFDHLTTVYIPAVAPELNHRTFNGFRSIIQRLYAPGGCPWDREQTHTSLRPYLLEETYEALEALDNGDPPALAEELGDLLLQIGLHCEIASEAGEFEYSDVFQSITTKLIRRHPHVFGDVAVATPAEVEANWQRIKQQERGGKDEEQRSILAGVPLSMPALAYSQAVQARAAQVGFDWERFEDVLDKLAEEIGELRQATTPEGREDEFGDILFVLTNLARWLGLDAEQTLRHANQKFARRFGAVESIARQRGIDMKQAGLPALDALWDEVKADEP